MKDTVSKSYGILAVAAVFGIIAAGVAIVMFEFGLVGAFFAFLLVALVTAIALFLGWREPAPHDSAVTRTAAPAPAAPPRGASSPKPAAAETAPAKAAIVDPAPGKTAAAAAATSAAAPAPAVKPSAALAGQDDLASRKGSWKYDGNGASAADATPDADSTAPATAEPVGQSASTPAAQPAAAPAEATGGAAEKPATLSAARDGGPDDLKQIKGVGPKMEGMLHSMGFYHFDQVASWGPKEVAWVDQNLQGFKGRVSRDNWVDQAKLLAAGGETEFSKKVGKGGVY